MINNINLTDEQICAVIVSFNGIKTIVECINSLSSQVECIVVVDNGSQDGSLVSLRQMKSSGLIDLLELGRNYGLGYALNAGIKLGLASGCHWVLTMDQDSRPNQDMMQEMIGYANKNPSVDSLSPNLISNVGGNYRPKSGSVAYAITSGNLVRKRVFDKVGLYDDSYFIDCLDFDFSLRTRQSGFLIHKVPSALMVHGVGDQRSLPKFARMFYTQHSPVRRYYMFRNMLLLSRKHSSYDFKFIFKLGLLHGLFFILLIAYGDKRLDNLKFISKGLLDGIRGRSGPYNG